MKAVNTSLLPTSVFEDVSTLVDQVAVLSVPLSVLCSLIAAPLETKTTEFVTEEKSGRRATCLCPVLHCLTKDRVA